MSCTVFALPYAIAWVVGAVFANVPYSEIALDNEGMNNIDFSGDIDLPTVCDDVRVISDKHFLEKSFETAFVDKELLIKTLEEHGVSNLKENEYGKITARTGSYELAFERMEADKPYFLMIKYLDTESAEQKLNDLSSEYALNVQEESYRSITEKLKENNMEIESEEVCSTTFLFPQLYLLNDLIRLAVCIPSLLRTSVTALVPTF